MTDSEKSLTQLRLETAEIIQAKKDADEKEVAPYRSELEAMFKKYAFADEALRKAISVGIPKNAALTFYLMVASNKVLKVVTE